MGDPVCQKMAELSKRLLNIQTWVFSIKVFYVCRNHNLHCYSKYEFSRKVSGTDLAPLLTDTLLWFLVIDKFYYQ